MKDIYTTFLQERICEKSAIAADQLDNEADMFENGYIDSIGIFTLFVEIEDRFNTEISLDTLENIEKLTINNLATIIKNELSQH